MPRFTVLVPTHDHADTLLFSIPSILNQTCQDFELFLVGDGVPERTRELVAALRAHDDRIRFFDNPKGPRHGEIHRHAALQEARGKFVCYLPDDDLWLPDHLETLEPLLGKHHLAHTLGVTVKPDGSWYGWLTEVSWATYARAVRQRRVPGIGLPCVGHTLEAYRRLPYGWRTTPAGFPTDLHMWLQFLEQPWIHPGGTQRPTSIHFSSPERLDWTQAERLAELAIWSTRLADPQRRHALTCDLLQALANQAHRASVSGQQLCKLLGSGPAEIQQGLEDLMWPSHYQPGTELTFGRGGSGTDFLAHGFADQEAASVRTNHPEAVLLLPLAWTLETDAELRLAIQCDGPGTLSINGTVVDDWEDGSGPTPRRIPLCVDLVRGVRGLVLHFKMAQGFLELTSLCIRAVEPR